MDNSNNINNTDQNNGDTVKHRFYGRRQGRALRQERLRVMNDILPSIRIQLPEGQDVAESIAPKSFFKSNNSPEPSEIWFEIGFGSGEHMVATAKNNPHIGIIGCEPFVNGVSSCLLNIEKENVDNIRIWPDDARLVLDALAPASLDKIFLLHPDPWPKKRHKKRRFIQTETLDNFARLMKPSAELRIATDDSNLCDWMLEYCWKHPEFEWTAQSEKDWNTRPNDWPETRYGKKQLAGIPVYLIFKRK